MSLAKKPKTNYYNASWEHDYCFIKVEDKCVCLLCNQAVCVPKKDKVSRHHESVHKDFGDKFPLKSALRNQKIRDLKFGLKTQQSLFLNPNNQLVTEASLRISFIIAKRKRPFMEGEIIKDCLLEASKVLFSKLKEKEKIASLVQDLQLSQPTVTRRFEALSNNVKSQLQKDIAQCQYFSLQFDDSTDIVQTSQLSVFIRMVFEDCTAKEEFLTIVPLKGQTRGKDIFDAFLHYVSTNNLPLEKLSAITTDGAPAMIGKNIGFVTFCKNDSRFPEFQHYHCIIHQEALCSKAAAIKGVMNVVVKIVNSIRAHALQRRLFRALLEEVDNQYGELLLHAEVRWLSRGKCLQRFHELLPEIRLFLAKKGDIYTELDDSIWLLNLAFMVDLTTKLNEVNLKLQGRDKRIVEMMNVVFGFRNTLSMLRLQVSKKQFKHFPVLKNEIEVQKLSEDDITFNLDYSNILKGIENEFEERFKDFQNLQPVVMFLENPFQEGSVEEMAKEIESNFKISGPNLELEIIRFQSNLILKSKSREDLWKFVSQEDFPILQSVYLRVHSFFPSTYLCEAGFSGMKIIKGKQRSHLTDDHLDDCLRLAVTCYEPEYENIAKSVICKPSNPQN